MKSENLILKNSDVCLNFDGISKIALFDNNLRSANNPKQLRLGLILKISDHEGFEGFASCHPWPELGDPSVGALLCWFRERIRTDLTERTLYYARVDLNFKHEGKSVFDGLHIPESHFLIQHFRYGLTPETWELIEKSGCKSIKLKVGNERPKEVYQVNKILEQCQERGITIRLDFNAKYSQARVSEYLSKLAHKELVDWIEDPCPFDAQDWQSLKDEFGIPLALDREVSDLALESNAYDVIVIKPAVQDVDKMVLIAKERNKGIVITSYLGHPIEQVAAAWEAAKCLKRGDQLVGCGVVSHFAYNSNIYSEQLDVKNGRLIPPIGNGFGFEMEPSDEPAFELDKEGNSKGVVLVNPRMDVGEANKLQSWLKVADHLTDHFFVLTSGTNALNTGDYKWVALSRAAVISSALACNHFLGCTDADFWIATLPEFHVGGLGIKMRSALLGRAPLDWKHVDDFSLPGASLLSSLVPTQVYDIVQAERKCPPDIKVIVVGGGPLEDDLYERARQLGWPLLRSYGLSETASQAATEPLSRLENLKAQPIEMEILPHLEMRTNQEGRIEIRGTSLLTGYVCLDDSGRPVFVNPKDEDGWFTTEDEGVVEGRILKLTGRSSDRIKISGELVNLAQLRSKLATITGEKRRSYTLIAIDDKRLGKSICLVYEKCILDEEVTEIISRFNNFVMPFERIREWFGIEMIPTTSLGKIKFAELLDYVEKQRPLQK